MSYVLAAQSGSRDERMTPKRALTREPGRTFTSCLSSHPMSHTVNYEKAKAQHASYRATLAELGLEVIVIPTDDAHPDACFVEDNAIVHGTRALICRMGAVSRRGEVDAVEAALRDLGLETKRVVAPGTIEGGDVVHLHDRLISGISQRTNREGVQQLRAWLGVKVGTIEDLRMMHLKSHVTCLDDGDAVIVSQKYAGYDALRELRKIVVPPGEEYAADTLAVGSSVMLPKGMPRTAVLLKDAGFDPVPIDLSEFEKCDGAITCLSILI